MFDMHLVSNYVKMQSSVNTQRFLWTKSISALPVQAIQSPCYTEPALHNVHEEFCFLLVGIFRRRTDKPNGLIFLGRTCTADVFCTPTRCFAVVKSAYQCGIWLAGIGKSHWSCLPASVCCSTHSDYWDALITFKCEAFWKLNADHDYSFSITLSCVVTAISNLTCYSLFLILFDSSVLLWGLMLFDNSFSKT